MSDVQILFFMMKFAKNIIKERNILIKIKMSQMLQLHAQIRQTLIEFNYN